MKERSVRILIYGQPPRKSNSRRIVRGPSGSPRSIKSKEALQYVESFVYHIKPEQKLKLGSKEKPLAVEGDIYYRQKFVADLSVELVLDALKAASVITDDRFVVWTDIRKRRDLRAPRIDLVVTELDSWDWAGKEGGDGRQ